MNTGQYYFVQDNLSVSTEPLPVFYLVQNANIGSTQSSDTVNRSCASANDKKSQPSSTSLSAEELVSTNKHHSTLAWHKLKCRITILLSFLTILFLSVTCYWIIRIEFTHLHQLEPMVNSRKAGDLAVHDQKMTHDSALLGDPKAVLDQEDWKLEKLHPNFNALQILTSDGIKGSDIFVENQEFFKENQRTTLLHRNQNITYNLRTPSRLTVHVKLTNVRLLPEYRDIDHPFSDNGIILDTSHHSNLHHWHRPLEQLLKTACRSFVVNLELKVLIPLFGCPQRASFLRPQRNTMYCTANSQLLNDVFDEYVTERQSYLKSAHCDSQRRRCQTCLRRSCQALNNQPGSQQYFATDLLETPDEYDETVNQCCGLACYLNPTCQEYFQPACQAETMSDPKAREVCLKGTTFKLTLNPEFDLANGSYMCHLEHKPTEVLFTLRTWISFRQEQSQMQYFTTDTKTMIVTRSGEGLPRDDTGSSSNNSSFQSTGKHGSVRLWNGLVGLRFNVNEPEWTSALLRYDGQTGRTSLYQLKAESDFGFDRPEIQRHREGKYTVVQFSKPFMYNTATWGNQSCHLNVSHLHQSQSLYVEQSERRVELAGPITISSSTTRPDKLVRAFEYAFKNADPLSSSKTFTEIRVEKTPESSLLYSIGCSKTPDFGLYVETGQRGSDGRIPSSDQSRKFLFGRLQVNKNQPLRVSLKSLGSSESTLQSWTVIVEGWVTKRPTYLNVNVNAGRPVRSNRLNNVKHEDAQSQLFHQSLLLFPLDGDEQSSFKQFAISFDLYCNRSASRHVQSLAITIEISDCQKSYFLHSKLDSEPVAASSTGLNHSDNLSATVSNRHPSSLTMHRIQLTFIILCLAIFSIHLLLACTYALVWLLRRRSSKRSPTRQQRSPPNNSLKSLVTKCCLVGYLSFRVFYTFLFTTSVGLSLILSIEPDTVHKLALFVGGTGETSRRGSQFRSATPLSLTTRPSFSSSQSSDWLEQLALDEVRVLTELDSHMRQMADRVRKCSQVNQINTAAAVQLIRESTDEIKQWTGSRSFKPGEAMLTQLSHPTPFNVSTDLTSVYPVDATLDPIQLATWRRLEQIYWTSYLDSVEQYLRQLHNSLDATIIYLWGPYDKLLERISTSRWLSTARRSMNMSNSQDRSASNSASRDGGVTGESVGAFPSSTSRSSQSNEFRALQLANFIGIAQPRHARLAGARIWNNLRALLPAIPSQLRNEPKSLTDNQRQGDNRDKVVPIFVDQRVAFNHDDWSTSGDAFSANQRATTAESTKSSSRPDKSMRKRSPRYLAYYALDLVQIRLIILALDAFLIVGRCCRTVQLVRSLWFGQIRRMLSDRPLSQLKSCNGSRPSFDASSATLLAQPNLSSPTQITTTFGHQLDGFVNQHTNYSTTTSMDLGEMAHPLVDRSVKQSLSNSPYHRVVSSSFDSPNSRFNVCYCCLNSHYLLILLGIVLILIGLILLWVTNRHIRPGWLLNRDNVLVKLQAIANSRANSQAIIRTTQPRFLNRNMASHRVAAMGEKNLLARFRRRILHEKHQIQLAYLTELCTVEQSKQSTGVNWRRNGPVNWTPSSSLACRLAADSRVMSTGHFGWLSGAQLPTDACLFVPIKPTPDSQSDIVTDKQMSERQSAFNSTTLVSLLATRDSRNAVSQLISLIGNILLTSISVTLAMGTIVTFIQVTKLIMKSFYTHRVRETRWLTRLPPGGQQSFLPSTQSTTLSQNTANTVLQ